MSTVTRALTLEQFRNAFAGQKPHFEYWDGEARQKAMPTKLHAMLRKFLLLLLDDAGFHSFAELTLRFDRDWEPIPDVSATIEDFPGPDPLQPVDVVVEILSPADSFSH